MATLRDYQRDAIGGVLQALANHGSTLVVMPTGTGKTVLFSEVCRLWPRWAETLGVPGRRCLVVAHREELVVQAAEKIRAAGCAVAVEMAESRSDEGAFTQPCVVVASVQTLSNPRRRSRFAVDEFGLGVVDEAHHAVAQSYRSVFDAFGLGTGHAGKLLGVTATPKRADDYAVGQMFESVAYEYAIEDAVSDGYLVPIHQQCVTVGCVDLANLRTVAGDFSADELERIMSEEPALNAVAVPTVQLAGDRPTLVFCAGVKHAALVAAVLNRYKFNSALALSGETPKEERRSRVRDFREGRLQFLVNCGLFLEGFDAPNCAVVVMAQPTKSLALYTQVLGRGTRPLTGCIDGLESAYGRRLAIANSAKPHMLVLDFVGNSGRHKIVTAADVLGGKYGSPVRDYAKKNAAEDARPGDVNESLERAKDELALEDEEMRRRSAIRARVQYEAQSVSPFDRADVGVPNARAGGGPQEMATPKQIWKLSTLGVSRQTAARYTKRQASSVIDKLMKKEGA